MDKHQRMYQKSWRQSQLTIVGYSHTVLISPNKPNLIEFVLEGMQQRISEVAQVNLSRPLLEEEVSDALAGICRTSCPGIDGLSRDFFEFFWEVIKVDLVDGLNEAWAVGCLPEQFKEGLIFLIPKV